MDLIKCSDIDIEIINTKIVYTNDDNENYIEANLLLTNNSKISFNEIQSINVVGKVYNKKEELVHTGFREIFIPKNTIFNNNELHTKMFIANICEECECKYIRVHIESVKLCNKIDSNTTINNNSELINKYNSILKSDFALKLRQREEMEKNKKWEITGLQNGNIVKNDNRKIKSYLKTYFGRYWCRLDLKNKFVKIKLESLINNNYEYKFVITNCYSSIFLNDIGNSELTTCENKFSFDGFVRFIDGWLNYIKQEKQTSIDDLKEQYNNNNIIGNVKHNSDFFGFDLKHINLINKFINFNNVYIVYYEKYVLLKLENSKSKEFALLLPCRHK